MSHININHEKCTGCKACEFACSYHHRKVFNPKLASLHIRRTERGETISIILYKNLTGAEKRKRIPCDHCTGEPKPLCVTYCVFGAIRAA